MREIVRVRFAPSPTGYLHIGGARTALYNWLFARRNRGIFLLRIEDTDEVRSTQEFLGGILESLRWLGLDWDEGPDDNIEKGEYGPYFQIKRQHIYKKYIDQLIAEGKAYYCYCTPEELETMRQTAMMNKLSPKYDGRCRNLNEEERNNKTNEGRKPVVRFKMPQEGVTKFYDHVRSEVEFKNALLDDFVILKSSGIPPYIFACVIDDHLMEITHVIRGDDHLSNTPRQVQLYNAFGWTPPQFAHISMILGQDNARLSKRHGATSVMEYKKNGYLPEALFNYLALLGWSTEDSQQIFTKDELKEKFSLDRCAKNPAVFDQQKLLWMNGEYIRKMDVREFVKQSKNFVPSVSGYDERYIDTVIGFEQEKIKTLTEIPGRVDFFFKDNIEYEQKAMDKISKNSQSKEILKEIRERIEKMSDYTKEELDKLFRAYAEEKGLKTSLVFHSVRVAVSGRLAGPGLFEMIELLGKDRVLKRIDHTLKNILP